MSNLTKYYKYLFKNTQSLSIAPDVFLCHTVNMYKFSASMLPITVRVDSDQKMQRYEVPGIELEYVPTNQFGHKEFTGSFLAGGKDGLAVSFCAEVPKCQHQKSKSFDSFTPEGREAQKTGEAPKGLVSLAHGPKSWVFNDDCFEVFMQPENSHYYYGWEINAAGSCLDYKVSLKEGEFTPTIQELANPISGVLEQEIAGQKICFDYNWESTASWRIEVEDEFLYLELFIPWSDFGLNEPPAEGSVWHGTINRIIPIAHSDNQALQSILDFEGVEVIPRFHQPKLFAEFTWEHKNKPE